jgi:hypothetical protein
MHRVCTCRGVVPNVQQDHGLEHTALCDGLGVVWGVASDLSQGPHGGGLDVVLGLIDEGVLQGRHAAGHDHSQGQRLAERGDEAEGRKRRRRRAATTQRGTRTVGTA